MIKKSLEKQGKRAAADELGISERTLYAKSNNSICNFSKK
jgi:transcriptional regulator with PAS, ATPase and Fis domain